MEKIATALADGLRANEKTGRRLHTPQNVSAVNDVVDIHREVTYSAFSRRMNRRYQANRDMLQSEADRILWVNRQREVKVERPQQAIPSHYEPTRLEDIAELEGDEVTAWALGEASTRTNVTGGPTNEARPPSRRDSTGDYMSAFMPSVGMPRSETMPLIKVSAHSTGASPPRPVHSRRDSLPLIQLKDVTADTRKYLVEKESQRKLLKREIGRRQMRPSRLRQQGLSSPGHRRIDDHAREVSPVKNTTPDGAAPVASDCYMTVASSPKVSRSPVKRYSSRTTITQNSPLKNTTRDGADSVSSDRCLALAIPQKLPRSPAKRFTPRKTITLRPGSRNLRVGATTFDLVKPPSKASFPIPPRRGSRNFGLPVPRRKANLDTLPYHIAATIYRVVLVANHEIFVCSCGLCEWSATKQPALTRVCRKMRVDTLPIYYGENKFMLRGVYEFRDKAPLLLRALTQGSRDMIRHIEISTHDIASAVCMMATLGFKLSHRLPRDCHLGVMEQLNDSVIWVTFTSINGAKKMAELEKDSPLKRRRQSLKGKRMSTIASIHVWDDDTSVHELESGFDFIAPDGEQDDRSEISSINTSILDPGRVSDTVIQQGIKARNARRRVVTLQDGETGQRKHSHYGVLEHIDDLGVAVSGAEAHSPRLDSEPEVSPSKSEKEKKETLDKIFDFIERERGRFAAQRATMRPKTPYSLEGDLLYAARKQQDPGMIEGDSFYAARKSQVPDMKEVCPWDYNNLGIPC